MEYERAKEYILQNGIRHFKKDKSGRGYICPICRSGSGQHGTGIEAKIDKKGTWRFSCFAGNCYGRMVDVIEVYQAEKNCEFWEAVRGLAAEMGISIEESSFPRGKKNAAVRAGAEYDQHRHKTPATPATAPATPATAPEPEPEPEPEEKPGPTLKQIQAAIKQGQEALKPGTPGAAYLESRGISLETAKRFGVGYIQGWRSSRSDTARQTPRLIIPYDDNTAYTARLIDTANQHGLTVYGKSPIRYLVEGKSGLIGAQYLEYVEPTTEELEALEHMGTAAKNELLNDPKSKVVFIVEGAIDAMAIYEVSGLRAVALNSTSNYKILVERLRQMREQNIPIRHIILALDNDKGGRDCTQDIAAALNQIGIYFSTANPYGTSKDAGEAILKSPEQLKNALEAATAYGADPDDATLFLKSDLWRSEIDVFRQGRTRKTGFPGLDDELKGVFNGLYLIGAASSAGKTTFCLQMAYNMAENGEHVIFYSLEQSRLELICKNLARLTFDMAGEGVEPWRSLDIRSHRPGETDKYDRPLVPVDREILLNNAKTRFIKDTNGKFSIVEPRGELVTIETIKQYVTRYIQRNNCRPVVFVDYLQLVQGQDKFTSGKDSADATVTGLKKLSRDYQIPVIAISSVNRSSYDNSMDFSAYKESGLLEYSADVAMGLDSGLFYALGKDEKTGEPRKPTTEQLQRERQKNIRGIVVKGLKNRNGRGNFYQCFEYNAEYDRYKEINFTALKELYKDEIENPENKNNNAMLDRLEQGARLRRSQGRTAKNGK